MSKDTVKFVNTRNFSGGLISTRPSKPGGAASVIIEILRNAEKQIQSKWDSLGGSPGVSKMPGGSGLIAVGGGLDGFYREYVNGRIYYLIGIGAFWVHGAIGDRYTELGGPTGWLGFPISDEDQFFDGRGSKFQNGAIYWWADTGAIDLSDIVVRYAGLACFGETANDMGSDSDEPYVIFGVVPAIGLGFSPRTTIYEDVDSGESREDNIELYRGLPYGLSLTALLMEHDLEDPDKYQETIRLAVDKASDGIGLAIDQIPYVGPFISPVAKALLKAVAPDVVEFFNDVVVGGEDDRIGLVSLVITPKDMVRLTRVERNNFRGILWHLDSPLITDGDASYKVYLSIEAV